MSTSLPMLLDETCLFLQSYFPANFKPKYGIILGTGLNDVVAQVNIIESIDYGKIPHFKASSVESHSGKLVIGYLAQQAVIMLCGRVHYYEGHSMQDVVYPTQTLIQLGIEQLIITSAVGSVNPVMRKGELILVNDHINLMPDNPLRGKNYDELGPRFPDLFYAYNKPLIETAYQLAKNNNIPIHKGVYAAVQGPNLETAAEYKMLSILGADVVGMSTVPEVIAAKHMGASSLVISSITDQCLPVDELQETNIDDVLAAAKIAEPHLINLLNLLFKQF